MSGVPITVPQLPGITPAAADSIPIWDADAGLQGRATVTGLGAVFALLTGATFTGGIAATAYTSNRGDNGAGSGSNLTLMNNPNATTPAPGYIDLRRPGGNSSCLYSDDSQLIRVMTGAPTSVTTPNGTVVGSQSSSLATKDVLPREPIPLEAVLAAVRKGAAAVRPFIYKAPVDYDQEGNQIEGVRPFNGEEFEGVIIDYAPRYAMDHTEANPEGKSLNEINILGDLLRAVDWLVAENAALTARVEALEAA